MPVGYCAACGIRPVQCAMPFDCAQDRLIARELPRQFAALRKVIQRFADQQSYWGNDAGRAFINQG